MKVQSELGNSFQMLGAVLEHEQNLEWAVSFPSSRRVLGVILLCRQGKIGVAGVGAILLTRWRTVGVECLGVAEKRVNSHATLEL